jgi:hypothetical protein
MSAPIENVQTSEYNAKNYTEQGGEKTVIGGTLEIADGAVVTGLTGFTGAATELALGGVKAAAVGESDTVEVKIGAGSKLFVPEYPVVPAASRQDESEAVDVAGIVADFNMLLGKLKDAGLMESSVIGS